MEAARKAANGTHIAIRIDNLRYDEGSDDKLRVDLLVGSLKTVGLVALPTDVSVGLTPDQGKQIRYEATAIVEMTESVPPRLHAILDGKPEGIIQFHELDGVGSIGDPSRGNLMAGFAKVPFYGAVCKKRGLMKSIALMSRASTQPRVEYACGLLQGSVTSVVPSMAQLNSQEIAALDEKIVTGVDEDESGLLAASGEAEADWIKSVARFQNYQATSAAVEAKDSEESKAGDSQFDRMMAAMAAQNAQQDKNLAQIQEAQAQSQQTQAQLMQMMAMMRAGQEQQRLTNTWVAKSMGAISESAGCAIEAPPASQEVATLPPTLARMTQPAVQGTPAIVPMATGLAAVEPAAGTEVPTVTSKVAEASPQRSHRRDRGSGGAAGAMASAIKAAVTPPARAKMKLPGNAGMPPTAETMDGSEDAEGLIFEPYAGLVDAGTNGQPSAHGTAEALKCLYGNLLGNGKPTQAQMMGGGARERTSLEIEGDAQRVEEQLLASTPPPQDF